MSSETVPLPDDPMSGLVNFEASVPAIKPGDTILIDDDGESIHRYEVLSVMDEAEPYVYDHIEGTYTLFEKAEARELLERDDSYHWCLLDRELIPIENSMTDSFVVFAYAIEMPSIPDGQRGVHMVWGIEEQQPVRQMPTVEASLYDLSFASLRDRIQDQDEADLQETNEAFSEDVCDILDQVAVMAEFNARNMFEMNSDPTYDEDTRRELELHAESFEETLETADALYD